MAQRRCVWCCLTFELSRPRRQTPAGRGRMIFTEAWSGQTVAAVAGRRLERGVRPHSAHAPCELAAHTRPAVAGQVVDSMNCSR